MADISPNASTHLKTLQQRISITTWAITLLLSLRGLFAFYGMKEKGSFEQIITFITEPMVQLFTFERLANLEIPGINVLFATVSFLLLSQLVQFGIWLADQRLTHARHYVYRHALRSTKQT